MATTADVGSNVFMGQGGQPIQQGDWLSYLVQDHNRFRDLISRAEALLAQPVVDITSLKLCMTELIREVSIHTSIEEQCVHDLYAKYKANEGKAWYDESLAFDQRDKESLAALEKIDPVNDMAGYRARCLPFFANITKHMTLEETLYWPVLQASMPVDVQNGLLARLVDARKSAPVHPHPEGPARSGLAKVMHPFTAAFDKITGRGDTSAAGSSSTNMPSGQRSGEM